MPSLLACTGSRKIIGLGESGTQEKSKTEEVHLGLRRTPCRYIYPHVLAAAPSLESTERSGRRAEAEPSPAEEDGKVNTYSQKLIEMG
jgi:hypothetical protein